MSCQNCKKINEPKKIMGANSTSKFEYLNLGNRKKFFNKLPKSNNISTSLISPQWVYLTL